MSRTQGSGGPPSDPLIPAGRPAGGASNAGSELELLRRKLKVMLPDPSPCCRPVISCLHPHITGMDLQPAGSPECLRLHGTSEAVVQAAQFGTCATPRV